MSIAKQARNSFTQEPEQEPHIRNCIAENCPFAGTHQTGNGWVCRYHGRHEILQWGAVTYALRQNKDLVRIVNNAPHLDLHTFETEVRDRLPEKLKMLDGENFFTWQHRVLRLSHEALLTATKEAAESVKTYKQSKPVNRAVSQILRVK